MPHLVLAVVATGWLIHVMHTSPWPARPTKTLYALAFGVALWSWVFGLTGAALRFLSSYSATRRYIADASYWIYLVHLPVVVAFQVWVGQWPLHWGVKYPFILVASFAVLFLSYHYLVRPTFIGQLLNGRKYPRKPLPPGSTPAPGRRRRRRRRIRVTAARWPSCAASPRSSAPSPRLLASTSKCVAGSC